MTPAEALVERTTRASGVPYRVEDAATLARLAAHLTVKAAPAIVSPEAALEDRRALGDRPSAA